MAASVAVIGAGIVGASVAYQLARNGHRVTVLDAREPGAGTTGNSFAWLNSVRKEPEAYHRLNAAGMTAYADLVAELGADIGFHGGGSLEWAEADAEQEQLRGRVERLAQRGYAAEWITRDAALRLEPDLTISESVRGVAFHPRDGWVHGPRAVTALLERVVTLGGEIRPATPVRSLEARGDRIEATITTGRLDADLIVMAVGPATAAMLASVGIELPVGRVPGVLGVTSPPAALPGRVVYAPGVHLRADVTGGLLLGADDVDKLATESTPPGPPPPFAEALLERARRAFGPAREVKLVAVRIGVRPMPGDGHTIAGRIPGYANAWVIATHSGITLGPLLGRLIATEIAGGAPSPELAPFRPDRFRESAPRTGSDGMLAPT